MRSKLLICIFFLSVSNLVAGQNSFPSSGNVGIGTTSPNSGANLHVRSTANYPRVTIQSTSATGAPGYSLGGSSSPFTWTMQYDIANQFLSFFYEGSGNKIVLKNDGKFGIGTIDPKTTLDVGGNLRLGSISEMPAEGGILEAVFGNYILGDQNQKLRLGVSNDMYTKAEIFIDNSNRPDGTISFKTSTGTVPAQSRMFIDGNGNVSIGTNDAKGYRFAVNGDAVFTKVRVKSFSAWPDYVFNTGYSLRSLDEVEQFIKENGRLPEMPSAEEVERDGIDVAATHITLVKKVEELTLYLIEQSKCLEEQRKMILEQQAEIRQLRDRK